MKPIILLLLLAITLSSSCQKSFLDAKPSTTIAEPNSLELIEKLLDATINNSTSGLRISSCDDYYYENFEAWQSTLQVDRNSYLWGKDIYEGEKIIDDWNKPFASILNANVAISALDKLNTTPENLLTHNRLKGWALFNRSWSNTELVMTFCLGYTPTNAETTLGIPLKSTPAVDEVKQRSSLKASYDKIIQDIQDAYSLLPKTFSKTTLNRPSKLAAAALLSRVYLAMSDFENCEKWTDSALSIYSYIQDFSLLDLSGTNPFRNQYDEIFYYARATDRYAAYARTFPSICADSMLYNSYSENDLRKEAYYVLNESGRPYMKRIYNPFDDVAFGGLATDELHLTKSECLARRNKVDASIRILNNLLAKRHLPNTYAPFHTTDAKELLDKILIERRKELVFRGLRWIDLKRLNLEGKSITLKRILNNISYELPPNSPLYALPIPDAEILHSGIEQNKR